MDSQPHSTTCQKQQQLSMETHENLVDAICLWLFLKPKIESLVSAEYMARLEELFMQGPLGPKGGGRDQGVIHQKTRHTWESRRVAES